jgi:hypothetical protein
MLRRPAPSLDILVVVLATVGNVHPVDVAVALITVEVHQGIVAFAKERHRVVVTTTTVVGQAR